MDSILRIAGIAVIALAGAFLLKEKSRTLESAAVICAFFIILLLSLEGGIRTAVETVGALSNETGFYSYTKTLVKALGIAYIATFTAELCSEAGENALKTGVLIGARAELIVLSLPLIRSLLDIAKKLL